MLKTLVSVAVLEREKHVARVEADVTQRHLEHEMLQLNTYGLNAAACCSLFIRLLCNSVVLTEGYLLFCALLG